ncbi:MAG: STAS domain-containing protein [Spirochaetaceae bacterium]|nr:STAS domain-containing protein [Spirochaetaceae bacterium]
MNRLQWNEEESTKVEEADFFKESDGITYVRAKGHLTARVCPGLKSRLFARLDSDPAVAAVFMDLASCEYMDSTFLGLIVGTQKRFSAAQARAGGSTPARRIVLVGPNEICVGLLRTLGVLGMVEIRAEGPAFPAELDAVSGGTKATAGLILDAHEELSALSDENKARFAALSTALRSALDAEKSVDKA